MDNSTQWASDGAGAGPPAILLIRKRKELDIMIPEHKCDKTTEGTIMWYHDAWRIEVDGKEIEEMTGFKYCPWCGQQLVYEDGLL